MNLKEWMYHGLLLDEEHLKSLEKLMKRGEAAWHQVKALKGAVHFRQMVMEAVESRSTEVLKGAAKVWLRYMVRKAELQMLRETDQIDRATFSKRSYALLDERDAELARIQDDFEQRRRAG